MESRTELVSVRLTDESTVLVEATMRGTDQDIALQELSFDDVRASIRGIARELGGVFAEVKPQKASVEFGLELAVESGALTALLVKGTGTASMKITLEWQQA